MDFQLEEEDRQLVLLALGLCSLLRPGFLYACQKASKKFAGEEMFEQFRRLNDDIVKPSSVIP